MEKDWNGFRSMDVLIFSRTCFELSVFFSLKCITIFRKEIGEKSIFQQNLFLYNSNIQVDCCCCFFSNDTSS